MIIILFIVFIVFVVKTSFEDEEVLILYFTSQEEKSADDEPEEQIEKQETEIPQDINIDSNTMSTDIPDISSIADDAINAYLGRGR